MPQPEIRFASGETAAELNYGLVTSKVLREITGQKRNRVFISDEIIKAIEG